VVGKGEEEGLRTTRPVQARFSIRREVPASSDRVLWIERRSRRCDRGRGAEGGAGFRIAGPRAVDAAVPFDSAPSVEEKKGFVSAMRTASTAAPFHEWSAPPQPILPGRKALKQRREPSDNKSKSTQSVQMYSLY